MPKDSTSFPARVAEVLKKSGELTFPEQVAVIGCIETVLRTLDPSTNAEFKTLYGELAAQVLDDEFQRAAEAHAAGRADD
jgi:hypothetical protein